jgi:hypothetical protein
VSGGAIVWSVAIQTKPVEIMRTRIPIILILSPELTDRDLKKSCIFIVEFSSLQVLLLMVIV